MLDLVTDVYLKDLVEKWKYPEVCLENIFPEDKGYEYVLKKIDSTAVWDIENGTLLCLSVKKRVKSAFIGFD
jgi:hypothetical protein